MKTKIIYISGNEIFKIEDIRAAFEEVRNALNLDKTTVLFGIPVDNEDTGLATNVAENEPEIIESVVEETEPEIETAKEVIIEPVLETKEEIESEIEQPVKKRGRPRKEAKAEEDVEEIVEETESVKEEKIVPILSVLETHEEVVVDEAPVAEEESIEIIPEISDEEPEETVDTVKPETEEIDDDDDGVKLEKLLSAMTPLEEDSLEEPFAGKEREETVTETSDIFDATLEQLATEFIETQDKIAAESKSSTRSKIGKLRNILPFKQSKHKDNSGLGDLFGWAGMAANDEDFSVPGFFTSAASKK
ncbi:MAG: hypothetical protein ACLRFP_02145 [Alphaproteobacteria bacterium]